MQNLMRLGGSVGLGLLFLVVGLSVPRGWSVPVYADGNVIQVRPDGQDQPDCGLAPVCKTVKYAVEERAQAGDWIQVAPGTYTETFTVLTTALKIYGAGPELTIIDGQHARGPLITLGPGLTSSTVLSGFSLQNGLATNGGGLYLSSSGPTIQFVTVQSNTAQEAGGGLYLVDGSPLITATLIRRNTAITGGGLGAVGASSPTLYGNTICGNSSVQLNNGGLGQVNASGVWWGTNTPQTGVDYSGVVSVTPTISASLSVHPLGATGSPGTTTLPGGSAAEVLVTMRGGPYTLPPGTQVTLAANKALFANGSPTTTLSLVEGTATAIMTPTVVGTLTPATVVISAYHDCDPVQAVISTTIQITSRTPQLYLPVVLKSFSALACPTVSPANFALIPVSGEPIDHPDYLHGDLNLARRGYRLVADVPLTLVDYPGITDPNPPQLPGLFADERRPIFSAAYQVNAWNWNCGEHGCPGDPLADWPTTLIGMATTPGESIFIPSGTPTIFNQGGQNYKALVLYAEEKRITLGYTRMDSVALGYSVHLENICVDPALLQLYRAQVGADGFRSSSLLPALTENQSLGTAFGQEMRVAIRDRGMFMDPRSRKDWWQGK